MKKAKRPLLIVGIMLAMLIGSLAFVSLNGMGIVRKMTVDPVDLTEIADGTYRGGFSQGRFSYSVEVTVKDHRIEAARPAVSRQARNSVVGQVLDRIVQEQTVAVDTVSGASLTTKAVAKAVENALSP